jgi:pimeloyl-ACP methyl ester carboxylesterase
MRAARSKVQSFSGRSGAWREAFGLVIERVTRSAGTGQRQPDTNRVTTNLTGGDEVLRSDSRARTSALNATPYPTASSTIIMPKVMVNGVNIHYQQAGSGPDLVLIHGLSGSLAVWQLHIVPELSRNFSVLTYDLRGHGQSDTPPSGYRSRDMAADLLTLLDYLRIERPHIVGHSVGGVVALHLAALHPDRAASLTISDSRVRALQPSQKLTEWVHWPLWKTQLEKRGVVLDEESEMDFLLLGQLVPPPVSEVLVPGATPQPSIASQRAAQWNAFLANTTAKDDLRDPAGLTDELICQISAPAHAIYGEYSFCIPTLAGLQRLLPNLKVTIIPKAGHFFPITQPEIFLSHLRAFYDSLCLDSGAGTDTTDPSPALGEIDLKQNPTP